MRQRVAAGHSSLCEDGLIQTQKAIARRAL